MRADGNTLTRKEVCYVLKWSRWTLWRREKEGCPFLGGRITWPALVWWLEQRDAALRLGMEVADFLKLSREKRNRLLEKATRLSR